MNTNFNLRSNRLKVEREHLSVIVSYKQTNKNKLKQSVNVAHKGMISIRMMIINSLVLMWIAKNRDRMQFTPSRKQQMTAKKPAKRRMSITFCVQCSMPA